MSDWHEIGQIWEFLRSDFSTLWSLNQNALKSDIKNSQIFSSSDQSDPLWSQTGQPDITVTQRISLASWEHNTHSYATRSTVLCVAGVFPRWLSLSRYHYTSHRRTLKNTLVIVRVTGRQFVWRCTTHTCVMTSYNVAPYPSAKHQL